MLEQSLYELKLTGNLPSPVGVGLALLRQTQNDDFTLEEVIHTLHTDPTLTGRLIRLANSSLNGGAQPATTVREAAIRLGIRTVRGVSLGFTLISGNRTGRCRAFDYDGYWLQSLSMAVATQFVAGTRGVLSPCEAFTCGLVAGIGRLALASIHPESYTEILRRAAGRDLVELSRLERERFAVDHAELGAAMLRDWKLPESFAFAVETSGGPDHGRQGSDRAGLELAGVLRLARDLARAICSRSDLGATAVRAQIEGIERVREALGMDAAAFSRLWTSLTDEWKDWSRTMGLPAPPAPALSDLEERARGERTEAAQVAGRGGAQPDADLHCAAPQGLRILAVDDDQVSLRVIARHLQREGHEVRMGADGREGLEQAIAFGPQLVITDWMMPVMDGLELVAALRRSEEFRRVPVMLLTGRDEDNRVVQAFDAGVDEYLTKPVNPRILLARVRSVQRTIALDLQLEEQRQEGARQLAQLAVMTRRLESAALTDPLTELPNRRFAMSQLRKEVEGWQTGGQTLSVIMIDVDRFKTVNDTWGHDVGDVVLVETAKVLQRGLRRMDVVCRLGGEEFLVICPQTPLATAIRIAERLRGSVEANSIRNGGFEGHVTISLGIAELDPADPRPDAVVKVADQRVYLAKQAGRNRLAGAEWPPAVQRQAG